MCYRISQHAMQRIEQRNLSAEELIAALDGRRFLQANGTTVFLDPHTRCAVVIDLAAMYVLTAFRLKRGKLKRRYSR